MAETKRLIIDIDEKHHRELKEYAARHGTTLKTIVLHALSAILQQESYEREIYIKQREK